MTVGIFLPVNLIRSRLVHERSCFDFVLDRLLSFNLPECPIIIIRNTFKHVDYRPSYTSNGLIEGITNSLIKITCIEAFVTYVKWYKILYNKRFRVESRGSSWKPSDLDLWRVFYVLNPYNAIDRATIRGQCVKQNRV